MAKQDEQNDTLKKIDEAASKASKEAKGVSDELTPEEQDLLEKEREERLARIEKEIEEREEREEQERLERLEEERKERERIERERLERLERERREREERERLERERQAQEKLEREQAERLLAEREEREARVVDRIADEITASPDKPDIMDAIRDEAAGMRVDEARPELREAVVAGFADSQPELEITVPDETEVAAYTPSVDTPVVEKLEIERKAMLGRLRSKLGAKELPGDPFSPISTSMHDSMEPLRSVLAEREEREARVDRMADEVTASPDKSDIMDAIRDEAAGMRVDEARPELREAVVEALEAEVDEVPDETDAPEVAEAPETAEAPEVAEAPEETASPEAAEAPETPEAPSMSFEEAVAVDFVGIDNQLDEANAQLDAAREVLDNKLGNLNRGLELGWFKEGSEAALNWQKQVDEAKAAMEDIRASRDSISEQKQSSLAPIRDAIANMMEGASRSDVRSANRWVRERIESGMPPGKALEVEVSRILGNAAAQKELNQAINSAGGLTEYLAQQEAAREAKKAAEAQRAAGFEARLATTINAERAAEAERIAAEQAAAEAERIAAEQAEAERIASEQAVTSPETPANDQDLGVDDFAESTATKSPQISESRIDPYADQPDEMIQGGGFFKTVVDPYADQPDEMIQGGGFTATDTPKPEGPVAEEPTVSAPQARGDIPPDELEVESGETIDFTVKPEARGDIPPDELQVESGETIEYNRAGVNTVDDIPRTQARGDIPPDELEASQEGSLEDQIRLSVAAKNSRLSESLEGFEQQTEDLASTIEDNWEAKKALLEADRAEQARLAELGVAGSGLVGEGPLLPGQVRESDIGTTPVERIEINEREAVEKHGTYTGSQTVEKNEDWKQGQVNAAQARLDREQAKHEDNIKHMQEELAALKSGEGLPEWVGTSSRTRDGIIRDLENRINAAQTTTPLSVAQAQSNLDEANKIVPIEDLRVELAELKSNPDANPWDIRDVESKIKNAQSHREGGFIYDLGQEVVSRIGFDDAQTPTFDPEYGAVTLEKQKQEVATQLAILERLQLPGGRESLESPAIDSAKSDLASAQKTLADLNERASRSRGSRLPRSLEREIRRAKNAIRDAEAQLTTHQNLALAKHMEEKGIDESPITAEEQERHNRQAEEIIGIRKPGGFDEEDQAASVASLDDSLLPPDEYSPEEIDSATITYDRAGIASVDDIAAAGSHELAKVMSDASDGEYDVKEAQAAINAIYEAEPTLGRRAVEEAVIAAITTGTLGGGAIAAAARATGRFSDRVTAAGKIAAEGTLPVNPFDIAGSAKQAIGTKRLDPQKAQIDFEAAWKGQEDAQQALRNAKTEEERIIAQTAADNADEALAVARAEHNVDIMKTVDPETGETIHSVVSLEHYPVPSQASPFDSKLSDVDVLGAEYPTPHGYTHYFSTGIGGILGSRSAKVKIPTGVNYTNTGVSPEDSAVIKNAIEKAKAGETLTPEEISGLKSINTVRENPVSTWYDPVTGQPSYREVEAPQQLIGGHSTQTSTLRVPIADIIEKGGDLETAMILRDKIVENAAKRAPGRTAVEHGGITASAPTVRPSSATPHGDMFKLAEGVDPIANLPDEFKDLAKLDPEVARNYYLELIQGPEGAFFMAPTAHPRFAVSTAQGAGGNMPVLMNTPGPDGVIGDHRGLQVYANTYEGEFIQNTDGSQWKPDDPRHGGTPGKTTVAEALQQEGSEVGIPRWDTVRAATFDPSVGADVPVVGVGNLSEQEIAQSGSYALQRGIEVLDPRRYGVRVGGKATAEDPVAALERATALEQSIAKVQSGDPLLPSDVAKLKKEDYALLKERTGVDALGNLKKLEDAITRPTQPKNAPFSPLWIIPQMPQEVPRQPRTPLGTDSVP